MSVGPVGGRSRTCRVLIVQSYVCCSCLSWWPLLPQFDSPGQGGGGGGQSPLCPPGSTADGKCERHCLMDKKNDCIQDGLLEATS